MVDCDVLRFGEFTLKSGRKSPFYMNAGLYVTGGQLEKARAILCKKQYMITMVMILMYFFGPAYKRNTFKYLQQRWHIIHYMASRYDIAPTEKR